jgi:hypothetical protein
LQLHLIHQRPESDQFSHFFSLCHAPEPLSQFLFCRSAATDWFSRQASLNSLGAISLGALPSNHGESQNFTLLPLSSSTIVDSLNSCLSISPHGT